MTFRTKRHYGRRQKTTQKQIQVRHYAKLENSREPLGTNFCALDTMWKCFANFATLLLQARGE